MQDWPLTRPDNAEGAGVARRPAAPDPESANLKAPQPQRAAWAPEPDPGPRPSKATLAAAVIMSLVLVVAMTVVAVTLATRQVPMAQPSPAAATPTAPSQSPTAPPIQASRPQPTPVLSASIEPEATDAAQPGPPSWVLPERTWRDLPEADPASSFYRAQATALDGLAVVDLHGCPEPAVTPTSSEWRDAVLAQWACVHASWSPVLESLGWSTVEPPVVFFEGAGSASECGYLEAPAFYCSTGAGTVYFGTEHFKMARRWDLSVNEMVNHEYGHHLQSLSGITATKLSLKPSDALERRVELQAMCWSGAMTYRNQAFSFDGNDYASWQDRLESMREDSVHGNRESMRYWGTRGLYAETMGDCNTWVVEREDVA